MDGKIQRRGAILFLIGFGAVLLTALFSLLITDHGARPLIEDVYRSVALFTGNSSWAFDASIRSPKPPLVFKILAVVAPFVSVLGLAELATGRTWSDWLRFRGWVLVRLGRKHPTAIFGLTPDSLQFARSLLSSDGRDLPIIFDPQPSLGLTNLCDQAGIPFFTLLPRQSGYLWRSARRRSLNAIPANLVVRAQQHVSFFADADEQVSFAQALETWLCEEGVSKKDTWLLMSQRGLRQRLDSYLKFSHKTLRLSFFDFYSLAARQLLHKHSLDAWADTLGQDQIHLAIYGFGQLGRAIAKEAVRYYVTRTSIEGANRKIRLTIIDKAPEAAKAAFLADEPEIEKILDIAAVEAMLQTSGLTSEQLSAVVPARVTAHIITLNEPECVIAHALSLRRWLLEPPRNVDQAWFDAHRNAPIFVPVSNWDGLGSLVRSGLDWPPGKTRKPEAPDGIFGFGNTDDLLNCEWILARDRDAGAHVLHNVYNDYMRSTDQSRPGVIGWSDLPPYLKHSNMQAFDHIWVKARAVGYRVVAISTGQTMAYPAFDEGEKLFLSQLEHQRYCAERISDGWRQAETRCDAIRVHPDLRDWADLSHEEQKIDHKLIEAMPAALFAVHKRLVKAHVVGIIGHRLPAPRDKDSVHAAHPQMDEAHVRRSVSKALTDIVRQNPGTVLLSALATGADTWAVEEAKALGIPWIVVLPLPFELYHDDFVGDVEGGEVRQPETETWEETFRSLVAEAEYYFELPLTAGRCSDMSRKKDGSMTDANRRRRDEQYVLAGRYIAERSDTLLAVWDGEAARGCGGTGELVALRSDLMHTPRESRPHIGTKFFVPPAMAPTFLISPKEIAPYGL